MRAAASHRGQLLRREETPVGQHGVERLDRVPFAVDVAVAFSPGRIVRIDAHYLVVKHIENVGAGEAAARMSRARLRNARQNRSAILD
jgi:hypothetical protein